jgi:hypothetical protein
MILPITEHGQAYNEFMSQKISAQINAAMNPAVTATATPAAQQTMAVPKDINLWAIGIGLLTSVLL